MSRNEKGYKESKSHEGMSPAAKKKKKKPEKGVPGSRRKGQAK
jgi:hypothetical protein